MLLEFSFANYIEDFVEVIFILQIAPGKRKNTCSVIIQNIGYPNSFFGRNYSVFCIKKFCIAS